MNTFVLVFVFVFYEHQWFAVKMYINGHNYAELCPLPERIEHQWFKVKMYINGHTIRQWMRFKPCMCI